MSYAADPPLTLGALSVGAISHRGTVRRGRSFLCSKKAVVLWVEVSGVRSYFAPDGRSLSPEEAAALCPGVDLSGAPGQNRDSR